MKFEPVFRMSYNTIFLNDFIFNGGYKDWGAVTTIRDGKWELFLPKSRLDKFSEDRYKEVLEGLDFEKFEEESLKAGKEVLEQSKKEMDNLSDDDFIGLLEYLFEIGGHFFRLYKKTEFFNFTRIEKELQDYVKDEKFLQEVLSGKVDISSWPEDKRKLAEYIIKMQHLKFKLRKIMNEAWMGPEAMCAKMLKQLTVRTKREDAVNMTLEEVKDCLSDKVVEDVSGRHVCSFMEWDTENSKLKVYSGEEAKRKIEELDIKIPENEVTGTPACRGFVKGKVKVIPLSMNPEQYLPKIEKGDILVSTTTGPEMVIIMQKVSAIVTDEGGMMSHAALISREFGIPCVVGTKHATEVFKDGDMVEVDAEKGVVRKISNL